MSKAGRAGFTLLELLAAFAVGAVVLLAVSGLFRNIVLHFGAGTRDVFRSEQMLLALDRLTGDLSTVRYIRRQTPSGLDGAFQGDATGMTFVAAPGIAAVASEIQVIALRAEKSNAGMRLVRRQGQWLGPEADLANLRFSDTVVLLEGNFRIVFAYRDNAGGADAWFDSWTGRTGLPAYVRLTLRDPQSGADLTGTMAFRIRAEAPQSCARLEANASCLLTPEGSRLTFPGLGLGIAPGRTN